MSRSEVTMREVLLADMYEKELESLRSELAEANHRTKMQSRVIAGCEQKFRSIPQYESKYRNLLAVIHRDGGHYLAEHGEGKASEDGIQKIMEAYHANDHYEEQIKQYREALERIANSNDYGYRMVEIAQEALSEGNR